MGANLWSYFVPYRQDIAEALEELKQQEFAAGRYDSPCNFQGTHSTIAEALKEGDADGTRSILDMIGVADSPRNPNWDVAEEYRINFEEMEGDLMFSMVAPIASKQLVALFGTERPTRSMIEAKLDYYNLLDRGLGLYIIVYEGDVPAELFFAGFSYD